jgi:hypothetical protein
MKIWEHYERGTSGGQSEPTVATKLCTIHGKACYDSIADEAAPPPTELSEPNSHRHSTIHWKPVIMTQ